MKKKYCDKHSTFDDWQKNETGIAVLPIGAFEQHGYHLPLATDTIQADYFAEYIAREFDAMLLPALPYGTSLEHKGFRGTISLTPRVLMDLLENIVDELESQNVTRLIVINGHGGNFALYPAMRKINREDRKIKIINGDWGQTDVVIEEPEIHAGEAETSKMLAIKKDLVGDDRRRSNPFLQDEKYLQSDLNTFGVGRMTDVGVWGNPTIAKESTGKKLIKAVKKNMVAFLKERLKRLDDDPRYGGPPKK